MHPNTPTAETHNNTQGISKMQPGQWVSLRMTKFPTDSLATVKLVDASGATAATVGASCVILRLVMKYSVNPPIKPHYTTPLN